MADYLCTMHYVSVENLTKSYGIQPLFENISFHIEEGDKIALIARNGSGKSTLLKILAGKEVADSGKVWINKDVDVALFEQEPVFDETKSILDNIFFHNHPVINAIKEFEALDEKTDPDVLNKAIAKMDDLGAWDFDAKVKQILGKLNIHYLQQSVSTLSGGQRKRVALAKTLIDIGFEHKHVLLIMDEPTNHLDVEMVEWLENYLNKENVTLLMVTHDRYFLDAVCEEIWEMEGSNLKVTREVDGGLETIQISTPAVVTTDLRLNEPRYISLPNIVQAKRKPLEIIPAESYADNLAPRLKTLHVAAPAKRGAGVKLETAAELVNRLKHEAQVI